MSKILKIEIRHTCFANIINYLYDNLDEICQDAAQKLPKNPDNFNGEFNGTERSIKYEYRDEDEADD